MRRLAVGLSVVLLLSTATFSPAPAQVPTMKDQQLVSRVLTDADMEKYVAILARVTQANKERKGATSPAAMQEVTAKKAKACEEQGWTTLDYGVVDARVTTAQMHLKMPNTPVPDSKKADVEIAKKFQDRIAAAKKQTPDQH